MRIEAPVKNQETEKGHSLLLVAGMTKIFHCCPESSDVTTLPIG